MKGFGMVAADRPGWIELPKPEAGPMDAVLRPMAVSPGIADVYMLSGAFGPLKNTVLGHEAIGEVVEVGNLVRSFKPGDIVVVPVPSSDLNWPSNTKGQDAGADYRNFRFKEGRFAEYFLVNQADMNMALLPRSVSMEAALMVPGMMATGFNAVEQANISFGDSVVVMGTGPIGLMAVGGTYLRGAGRIFAVGSSPNSFKVAREYGATHLVNPDDGDVVEQILDLNLGGVDAVIIAGGDDNTFDQAIKLLNTGGIIANVNYSDPKTRRRSGTLAWNSGVGNRDIRAGFGSGGSGSRIKKLLRLLEYGKIKASKLITHKFDGFDQIEDSFELMRSKNQDLIKSVVFIKWP